MKTQKLAIYMRHGCYYCSLVMGAIEKLGLEVDVRNIWEDPEHEKQLVMATNRSVVPVLYYEDENNKASWMPESADIIAFLNKQGS